MPSWLRVSERPLTEIHDVALLDLDGVVYIGRSAVRGGPEALRRARDGGLRLAFVTNNAARTPEVVAEHLTELGVPARADEVITSAQAAARYLSERLPAGARVLVVGTVGLVEALRERGLTPVPDAYGQVDAVVQGYSPDMNWRLLAEGAVALNRGVPWVATNVDPTVPSDRGPLPGNGSLVAALRHATGRTPVVTGKPEPAMHRESVLRSGAERPVVVGDRLDTDIEGASAVGCPSLLVLTGVTRPADLLTASPAQRPTYVSADLGGLMEPHPAPELSAEGARCGRWRAWRSGENLSLASDSSAALRDRSAELSGGGGRDDRADVADGFDPDTLDALRALCAASWAAAPESNDGLEPEVAAADDAARPVLVRLGLSDSG